jgi:hypothetical protein
MSSAPRAGLSCVGFDRRGLHVDEAWPAPGRRFHRREVIVAVGVRIDYIDAEWRGALVLVEEGEIDLCCSRGGSRRFGTGAVLFFDGLGLVALRNPGLVDTVLVALTRR